MIINNRIMGKEKTKSTKKQVKTLPEPAVETKLPAEEAPKEVPKKAMPAVEKKIRKQKPKPSRRSQRMNKLLKEGAAEDDKKAVVYIGHLPYGFEETGLRKFFEQFGKITRLKMSRSKKVCDLFVNVE